MANIAVLRDGITRSSHVRAVVAPKAPWKLGMAEIVRIGAPSHLEIRKDIAFVDRQNSLGGVLDVLGSFRIQIGIAFLVVVFRYSTQGMVCLLESAASRMDMPGAKCLPWMPANLLPPTIMSNTV